jgi:hypothetical protein
MSEIDDDTEDLASASIGIESDEELLAQASAVEREPEPAPSPPVSRAENARTRYLRKIGKENLI